MSFIGELRRRNVFKVAAAYVIVGWLIMQAGEVLSPALHLPDWINSALAFFLILGFPLALIFAWAFEMTPDGIKKEKDVDRSGSVAGATGKKLNLTIIIVLALALGLFAFDKFVLDPGRDATEIATAVQVAQQQADELTEPSDSEESTDQKPAINHLSIAVLPFENRSNREEDQFFTDGMHDDLLTTIAKIGSMKVISRTSVMEYRDTVKKIPQIAQELGVANILEGGIQRSGSQVRINMQLIDAATDEHLWAEIYDRELTAENLFAVQSEITKAIANALQATLSPQEQQRIEARPTDNLEAYDAYMRGRQLMATRDSVKLKLATEEFNKATEIDPLFALAWVGLADSLAISMGWADVRAEDAYPIMEDAVKNALAIDNGLGEAYASLAWIHDYYGRNDEVEIAYQKAIELSPNYASAYQWYSQHIGDSDPLRAQESIDLMQKASKLDPRSRIITLQLGSMYGSQGLFSLAQAQYRKTIKIHPDFSAGYSYLASLYLYQMGQFDKALLLSKKANELNPRLLTRAWVPTTTYLQLGDLEAVQELRKKMASQGAKAWRLGLVDVMINVGKENPTGTREALNALLPEIQHSPRWTRYLGFVALTLGDIQHSREIFLSLEPGWLEPEQWPGLIERHTVYSCAIAWVLMNTGNQDLGTALLQQTTSYIEETLPSLTQHPDLAAPDTCYLVAGDTEKALLSIETQLAHNHLFAWNTRHRMPMYDLIREEPRYQAAVAERERRIAVQREAIARINKEAGNEL